MRLRTSGSCRSNRSARRDARKRSTAGGASRPTTAPRASPTSVAHPACRTTPPMTRPATTAATRSTAHSPARHGRSARWRSRVVREVEPRPSTARSPGWTMWPVSSRNVVVRGSDRRVLGVTYWSMEASRSRRCDRNAGDMASTTRASATNKASAETTTARGVPASVLVKNEPLPPTRPGSGAATAGGAVVGVGSESGLASHTRGGSGGRSAEVHGARRRERAGAGAPVQGHRLGARQGGGDLRAPRHLAVGRLRDGGEGRTDLGRVVTGATLPPPARARYSRARLSVVLVRKAITSVRTPLPRSAVVGLFIGRRARGVLAVTAQDDAAVAGVAEPLDRQGDPVVERGRHRTSAR